MGKDAFWFPHDANARNDPAICEMRAKYRSEGYGWYWILIEMMREAADYKLKHKNTAGYSLVLCAKPDKVISFISDCVSCGLFRSNDECFWSDSLIRRMENKDRKSEIGREAANRRWQSNDGLDELPHSQKRSSRLRAARARGSHEKYEWDEMLLFFGSHCVLCGERVAHLDKDHITPICVGGDDSIRNIQPLCAACNAGKTLDRKDYRPMFCTQNGLVMPAKWMRDGCEMDAIRKEDKREEDSIAQDTKNDSSIEESIPQTPKSKPFAPPTVDEVSTYCRERCNSVVAQTWHDFYSSKGWMIGKNKMKDWKAAVRTWEKNRDGRATNDTREEMSDKWK